MRDTPGSPIISPKLQKIAEQARNYPEMVFNNLYHLIDDDLLLEAYQRTSKDSAPGVDKVTAKHYAEALYENLHDLHERLKSNRYVAPPVERVWIEKEGGKQRPIGKPCYEDKIVQRAVVMILGTSSSRYSIRSPTASEKVTVSIRRYGNYESSASS